jgi:hypothetical protein
MTWVKYIAEINIVFGLAVEVSVLCLVGWMTHGDMSSVFPVCYHHSRTPHVGNIDATTDWPIINTFIAAGIIKTVSDSYHHTNRWWQEYHRRFVRTCRLITITVASSYQPAIIVHHHSCFAPPTDGDNVLLITAASPYESAVKTFSLPAYCRIRRW